MKQWQKRFLVGVFPVAILAATVGTMWPRMEWSMLALLGLYEVACIVLIVRRP